MPFKIVRNDITKMNKEAIAIRRMTIYQLALVAIALSIWQQATMSF